MLSLEFARIFENQNDHFKFSEFLESGINLCLFFGQSRLGLGRAASFR